MKISQWIGSQCFVRPERVSKDIVKMFTGHGSISDLPDSAGKKKASNVNKPIIIIGNNKFNT